MDLEMQIAMYHASRLRTEESNWYDYATVKDYLLERDGDKCCWCGRKIGKEAWHGVRLATIEHLIPVSQGGGPGPELLNLALACKKCNNRRGSRICAPGRECLS